MRCSSGWRCAPRSSCAIAANARSRPARNAASASASDGHAARVEVQPEALVEIELVLITMPELARLHARNLRATVARSRYTDTGRRASPADARVNDESRQRPRCGEHVGNAAGDSGPRCASRGERFENLEPHLRIGDGFWRWQRERRAAGLPRRRPRATRPSRSAGARRRTSATAATPGAAPVVWWLGHATVLLRVGGLHVITDPHLGRRASPLPFAGPRPARPRAGTRGRAAAARRAAHLAQSLRPSRRRRASARSCAVIRASPATHRSASAAGCEGAAPRACTSSTGGSGASTTASSCTAFPRSTGARAASSITTARCGADGSCARRASPSGSRATRATRRGSRRSPTVSARPISPRCRSAPTSRAGSCAPQHIDPPEAVRVHEELRIEALARHPLGNVRARRRQPRPARGEPARRAVAARVERRRVPILRQGEARRA